MAESKTGRGPTDPPRGALPASPVAPAASPASRPSPFPGSGDPGSSPARLASLPPPPELHELDGGWGESAATAPAEQRAKAAAPAGEAAAAPPSSDRAPGPSSSPQVTARDGGEIEAEFAALCATAEAANARVAELEAELARRSAALAAAERTIAELRLAVTADAASLEQAVAAAREEGAVALAAAEHTIAGLRAELEAAERTIDALREELAAARAAASAATLAAGADDLRAVKGIGPKLAAKLVALGITSYRQLAELGPDDLAPLAELVGVPLKRIERDGWVESARALLARGSTSGSSPPGDGDAAEGTP